MANGAWLWKLGLWGLVILFGFLYLGSVERHRDDADRGPPAQSTPAAVSEAEVDDVEPGVVQPVAALDGRAAAAVETQAAMDPAGPGDSGAPVSLSQERVPGDAVERADGAAVSSAVSQAEARAFAQAVMSDDGAEHGKPAAAATVGESPEPPTANAPIPAPIQTLPQTAVAPITQPAAAEAPAVSATVPVPPSAVPPGTDRRPRTAGSTADAAGAPALETAAQHRARIMAEYRAMQQAAREEMRKRWSRPGGSSPYGAYPQWGYSQGYPPRWGQPPAFAPGDYTE